MSNQNRGTVVADATKTFNLRNRLGWTQEEAGHQTDYSERLIRKLEGGKPVRVKSLIDVLSVYHAALKIKDWQLLEFFSRDEEVSANESTSDGQLSEEAYIQKIRDYFDLVFNQRKPEHIEDFLAPDVVFTGEGTTRTGIEVVQNRAKTLLEAFEPIQHVIHEAYCQSQTVVTQWEVKMRHVGDFFDIPPTNKWVKARGTSITKIENGLAIELEDLWDVENVFRQLRDEAPLII